MKTKINILIFLKTSVQNQVDEVIDVMQENITKVIERGERLDELQDKSGTDMSRASQSYRPGSGSALLPLFQPKFATLTWENGVWWSQYFTLSSLYFESSYCSIISLIDQLRME